MVYINDLPDLSNQLKPILFADDTTFLLSDRSFSNLIPKLNSELNLVYDWTIYNRLSVNSNKTNCMLFSNRHCDVRNDIVKMGPDTLNFTNSFKFLGVTIDDKLSFSEHIASVKGKVAKFTGILYKIKDQLPVEVRVRFYYSFVYPHLSYNIAVWGSTHANLINPLYLLQKRVVRNIAGESYLTHTAPLFKKFSLLKLKDIFTYHICLYMYIVQIDEGRCFCRPL